LSGFFFAPNCIFFIRFLKNIYSQKELEDEKDKSSQVLKEKLSDLSEKVKEVKPEDDKLLNDPKILIIISQK
jgi:hypothetical protein